jgi:hypothetical protein
MSASAEFPPGSINPSRSNRSSEVSSSLVLPQTGSRQGSAGGAGRPHSGRLGLLKRLSESGGSNTGGRLATTPQAAVEAA